jgi:phosphoribosylaminoimidazole (AIR) synthetase
VLPDECDAVIETGSWPIPPLFELVGEVTPRLSMHELYRTLNMGIGMVAVCAPADVDEVRGAITEPTWIIGELVPASSDMRRVQLR